MDCPHCDTPILGKDKGIVQCQKCKRNIIVEDSVTSTPSTPVQDERDIKYMGLKHEFTKLVKELQEEKLKNETVSRHLAEVSDSSHSMHLELIRLRNDNKYNVPSITLEKLKDTQLNEHKGNNTIGIFFTGFFLALGICFFALLIS